MPLIRLELKNEYGLGHRKLLCAGDSKKDDPKNILEGISVGGLVGILRQLGDLAEFAANVFHDLQEQVAATSSRWEKISNKIQCMESALPSLENAIQGQMSRIHFAYIPGSSWHANVLPHKSKLLMSHLPKFMVDLYEECRSPPQLHLLDKFDSSGHGACSKRYSDPSYFKKALASSEPIIVQKGRRKKKKRRLRPGNGLQHTVCTSQCSDSTQYVSPNFDELSFTSDASFSKSRFSDANPKSEMARKSIHLDSELKSKNTHEKVYVIPCLESDEPNYTGPFGLESNHTNAFDFIVRIESKHDIADDDSQQQISPSASSVTFIESNLKPDLEGESLHSEPELKSSNTLEQFPLIPCLESDEPNNIGPTESESNASDHIICSEAKQDVADDDSQKRSTLSTSVVWYDDEKTEVVKPTCTNLYEHEVFNDDLNLDSLQFSYPSSSGNETPQFKNNDEEDTMFELAFEPVSHNGTPSNINSDLKTTSLEGTCSPNFDGFEAQASDESYNFQDNSIPNIVHHNQSTNSTCHTFLSASSFKNDNSKLSYESSIIDEQDLQTNDEDEIIKSQNHSSDSFNPPAVHIWTNGNILGLEPSKPPDFIVKANSEAPTVTTENEATGNSISFSGLAHKLLPDNIQRKKLVANSGLSAHSLFMNSDFMKLQEIIHHNGHIELPKEGDINALREPETKENIKAGSCSPPLECMKFSFLPMNDLKKNLLNLEFSGSNVHEGYDDVKYCYHLFHLIPESSIGMQDSGPESDDDTFCRSSIYSDDDDIFSYKSKSSSEVWEEDDQSQFQKHRVSSSA